ncbi:YncE family protein [Haloarcula onubensis]|uniref:YncE family protein n=1 Tax=Haloarcula onubensis TaxID=2950539 RepID=A0ABU2FJP8_9EURY|nr:YncE family protein [Halomicroarcula sp. S3CR25-11]MDS0280953.1 YncE family protein [Halomicroarcula sp. S3CR25-11]
MNVTRFDRRSVLQTVGALGGTAVVGDVVAGQNDETTEGTDGGSGDRPLVVTCRNANAVALFDQANREITAEISVGEKPLYCAVSTDGDLAYAPNTASNDVSVVDIQRREEVERIPLEASPRGVNVHPETEEAFVEVAGSNQVAVVDNESLERTETIDVGEAPHNVVFDVESGYAYVTNQGGNSVGFIDLDEREMVDRVTVENAPHNLHVDQERGLLYTANALSNDMGIVDTEERELLGKRPLTDQNADIHATQDGEKIFVAGVQSDAVTVYRSPEDGTDPSEYRVDDIVTVEDQDEIRPRLPDREFVSPGLGPHGCFVSPYREEVYVTLTGRDQLVILDSETHEILDRVSTPSYPFFTDVQYDSGN